MISYRAIHERLCLADYGTYESYGIGAYETDHSTTEPIALVSDVFLSLEEAEKFTKLCNQCGLSLLHFQDAIEDAVSHTV